MKARHPKIGAWAPKIGAWAPKIGAWAPKIGASAPKIGASAPKIGASAPEIEAQAPGKNLEVVTSWVASAKNLKMYIRGAMFSEGWWVLEACMQQWSMPEMDAKHRLFDAKTSLVWRHAW